MTNIQRILFNSRKLRFFLETPAATPLLGEQRRPVLDVLTGVAPHLWVIEDPGSDIHLVALDGQFRDLRRFLESPWRCSKVRYRVIVDGL